LKIKIPIALFLLIELSSNLKINWLVLAQSNQSLSFKRESVKV